MAPHAMPTKSTDSVPRVPDIRGINGQPETTGSQLNSGLHAPDKSMPIAIIGMGCRCAGDATNPENLWRMVSEARESWSLMPESKYNADAFYHPDTARNGTVIGVVLTIMGPFLIDS